MLSVFAAQSFLCLCPSFAADGVLSDRGVVRSAVHPEPGAASGEVSGDVKLTDTETAYGEVSWNVDMSGYASSAASLPFWSVTNKNGVHPGAPGGMLVAGAGLKYRTGPGIDLYSGVSLAGTAVAGGLYKGFVDKLYFGIGWKKLRLDLGMIDRPSEFNGLSLTGGNIVNSGNARNFTGYNLSTGFMNIPGTKGIFAVKANFADYKFLDKRYTKGVLLHNQALAFKFAIGDRVDFILGVELWSQWGGMMPAEEGRPAWHQPQSFKDYLRVLFVQKGGSDATVSDQINVLGNHLGRELIRVNWRADGFTMVFQHDIPFDDGSGMGFQNFPDGVNTISFSFNDRKRWVTDILYEFVFTKCQSGSRHDRPAKPDELEKNPDKPVYVIGGNDDYFNNSGYRSGWTYYGQTIGLPLFTPMPANEDGIVMGVVNNRVIAHHLGLAGVIARTVPYKLLVTYSKNFGRYSYQMEPFKSSVPEQVSMALEATLPRVVRKVPVSITLGLYGDVGELYPNNFGATLKLNYYGRHLW